MVYFEIEKLSRKFPTLEVFAANSSKSSYEILSESEVVATWYSTIGLEAIYRGIPTISFNSGDWDNCVDVIKVFNRSELNGISFPLNKPNHESAIKFVAGSIALDIPMLDNFLLEKHRHLSKTYQAYRLDYLFRVSEDATIKLIIKAILINYQNWKIHTFVKKFRRELNQKFVKFFKFIQ